MKKFLNGLWQIFETMGQARAATVLARAGKLAEAKALFVK